MRRLHVHWWTAQEIHGPFALSRQGALGTRRYECRCGEQRWQEDWQRVDDRVDEHVSPACDDAPVVCKHCGRPINGTVHTEGGQAGLQRCDPADSGLPYGYNAAPVGEPCRSPCIGATIDD